MKIAGECENRLSTKIGPFFNCRIVWANGVEPTQTESPPPLLLYLEQSCVFRPNGLRFVLEEACDGNILINYRDVRATDKMTAAR